MTITLTKTFILLFILNICIHRAHPDLRPNKFWSLIRWPAASDPPLAKSPDTHPTAKPIKLPDKGQHLNPIKPRALSFTKRNINQKVPWCPDHSNIRASVKHLVLDPSKVSGLPDETHPPVIQNLAKYRGVKCSAGCKKNPFTLPGYRPRLDDPERFVGYEFSIVQPAFLKEVVGEHKDIDQRNVRVMFGQESFPGHLPDTLHTTHLQFYGGTIIQRISFTLGVQTTVCKSGPKGENTLQLPTVVPHVIFYYHYKERSTPPLKPGEKTHGGRVMLEMHLPPMTLTGTIKDNCEGLTMSTDPLKKYNVDMRIRPYHRSNHSQVASDVQEIINKETLFGAYISQVDKFFSKMMKEILEQKSNVIQRNQLLEELCKEKPR